MLRDSICTGWVTHRRRTPVKHEFRSKVSYVCLDIDQLDRLDIPKLVPISVRASDFANKNGSVRQEIENRISERGWPLRRA